MFEEHLKLTPNLTGNVKNLITCHRADATLFPDLYKKAIPSVIPSGSNFMTCGRCHSPVLDYVMPYRS